MRRKWTIVHNDGPNHLGLWCNQAMNYPAIGGLILDATFDGLCPLAVGILSAGQGLAFFKPFGETGKWWWWW